MLTQDRLKTLLRYSPETGEFYFLTPRGGRKRGCVAGTINKKRGYRYIVVDGRMYMAHRLAWFYMTGSWPAKEIDHKNRVRHDNHWSNLREANSNENHWNCSAHRDSAAPYKGVTWDASRGKWKAAIGAHRRFYNLGRYGTAEEARDAYLQAAARLHGEFIPGGG